MAFSLYTSVLIIDDEVPLEQILTTLEPAYAKMKSLVNGIREGGLADNTYIVIAKKDHETMRARLS